MGRNFKLLLTLCVDALFFLSLSLTPLWLLDLVHLQSYLFIFLHGCDIDWTLGTELDVDRHFGHVVVDFCVIVTLAPLFLHMLLPDGFNLFFLDFSLLDVDYSLLLHKVLEHVVGHIPEAHMRLMRSACVSCLLLIRVILAGCGGQLLGVFDDFIFKASQRVHSEHLDVEGLLDLLYALFL